MSDLMLFLRQWHREVERRGDDAESQRIEAALSLVNPFTTALGISVEPKGPRGDVFTRDGDALRQSTISKTSGEIYHTRVQYSQVQKTIAVMYLRFRGKPFTRQDLEQALKDDGVPADGKSYCCVIRWLEAEEIIPLMGSGAATLIPDDTAQRVTAAWNNLPVLPTEEAVAVG